LLDHRPLLPDFFFFFSVLFRRVMEVLGFAACRSLGSAAVAAARALRTVIRPGMLSVARSF